MNIPLLIQNVEIPSLDVEPHQNVYTSNIEDVDKYVDSKCADSIAGCVDSVRQCYHEPQDYT